MIRDENPYDSAHIVETATSTLQMFHRTGQVEKLGPVACLEAYKSQYVSARGDVLLVQSETVWPPSVYTERPDFHTANDTGYTDWIFRPLEGEVLPIYKRIPSFIRPTVYPSFNWQCNPRFNRTCPESHTSPREPWEPYGSPVLACLSEKVSEHCELNWQPGFAIAVLISNITKVVCMSLTVWNHEKFALMTIGDAIQSFLNRPDLHTRGFCMQSDYHLRLSMRPKGIAPLLIQLVSKYDAIWSSCWNSMSLSRERRAYLKNEWQPRQQRWWKALSPYR